MTTLSDIGLILHEERKRQGLSIADIMAETHISRISLTAIEEGREDALPHKVYAKGFIRNYAQVLGLDAEELLAEYKVETDEEPIKSAPSAITSPEPRPTRIGATLVVVLFGVLVGVITAGYMLYFNGMNKESPLRTETPSAPATTPPATPGAAPEPPAEALEEVPTSAPAFSAEEPPVEAPPVAEITEKPTSEQVEPSPSTTEIAGQTENPAAPTVADVPIEAPVTAPMSESAPSVTSIPTAQSEPQAPLSTAEATPETATPTLEAADGVNVALVTANEPCWMQARYANGRVQEAILKPGDTLELRFEGGLQLRLGNAGGVSIALNGAPVSISAQSGEVRTLRLP